MTGLDAILNDDCHVLVSRNFPLLASRNLIEQNASQGKGFFSLEGFVAV